MWIHHRGSYSTKPQNIISTQWVKKQDTPVLPTTLPPAGQFSKFCSKWSNPIVPQMRCYTTVWKVCSEIDLTSEYTYKDVIFWELIRCFSHGSAISKIAWSAWRDAVHKSWAKPTTMQVSEAQNSIWINSQLVTSAWCGWFIGCSVFTKNSQNDRLYVPAAAKKNKKLSWCWQQARRV